MNRYFLALAAGSLLAGCRPQNNGVEQTRESLDSVIKTSGRIRPDEPIEHADEPRYPTAAADASRNSNMRPLPTVQFEPSDLTSSVGLSAIRVNVYNLGDPAGTDVLNLVANQVQLHEWPSEREVPISVSVHDVDGPKYGVDGYRRNESAYVSVQPAAALADQWYVVRLRSLPGQVAAPALKAHLLLPDGTIGARFSPGSHPVVSGLRICDKGQGNAVAMLDFSERVNYVPGVVSLALAGAGAQYCTPDPALSTMGASRSFRFLCAGLPRAGARLQISASAPVTSPSGGALEVPGQGKADLATEIEADKMQFWGTGCTIGRPW